jgi:hypothetical protein
MAPARDDLHPSDQPGLRDSVFLVALPAVPDLFICAKHLFFDAMVTTDGR